MVQVKKKIREVQCLPPKLLAVVIIVSLGFIAKSQINYLMKASYTISTEQIVTPDTTQETNRNEIALKTNSTDKLSDASSKETKSMEEELKLDSNEEAKKVEQVEINEVQNKSQPEITILLSYPNSGTSYTITTVQAVSKKSSASNYSKESKSKKNLFPDHPEYHGPYLLNNKMDIPKKVLTKTHCWGYKDGRIKYYLVSVKKFPGTCFRSRGLDGKYVGYHKDIIPKTAVRLVRDPFDNIVSNYHLSMKIHHGTKSKSVEEDKKRFQHHCEQKDHTFEKSIKNTNVKMFKTETAKSLMANVPCHQSFFRYVQVSAPCHIFLFYDCNYLS